MRCPVCSEPNPANARFCSNCGGALPASCVHCGARLPAGARFCPACGRPAEQTATPAQPADERRQVTVLFADLVGFTQMVRRSEMEEVRETMKSLWSRLDAIIAAHGGVTEKHIGDAIIAIFGARQAREDDPVQAVRAALAMQAAIGQLPATPLSPPLQMRIGVHTGLVVVGPQGRSGELVATGETVNLANRLEQRAPPGGVLVSRDTFNHIYGLFDVEQMPALELKGWPEPVAAYLVIRACPVAFSRASRSVEHLKTEMIGRQAELDRLKAVLRSAIQERQLQWVTIVGDAGIGKSRLLQEFQEYVGSLPQMVRWFFGRASPDTEGLSFGLIRKLLAARFEVLDSDPPPVAWQKLQQGLRTILNTSTVSLDCTPEALAHQAESIGQLVGWHTTPDPAQHSPAQDVGQIRDRAFEALSRFFRAASVAPPTAGAQPVCACVLVFEDVHWSDPGSLDLMGHLSRTCDDAPVIILCLARPAFFERRAGWGEGHSSHTRLDLKPLSRGESADLVERIFRHTPDARPELRDLIVGRAEGIPFYIEEIIQMMRDKGMIVPSDGSRQAETQAGLSAPVPATLTGVLQARLDELAPSERDVLQRASVIGRVFWDSAIEAMGGGVEPPHVPSDASDASGPSSPTSRLTRDALAGLRRKEIIFRREASAFAGAVEYIFKHELLRDVAYEGLVKQKRRDYHADVAGWLIEQSGSRVDEFAGLVAAHLEHAGQISPAAQWYGRAGQRARATYSPATGVAHFRKALSLSPMPERPVGQASGLPVAGPPSRRSPTDPQESRARARSEPPPISPAMRQEWQEGLGEVLTAQAQLPDALAAYEQARALAESVDDILAQARAWNGLAFVQERLGRNRASIESADRAESIARRAGQPGQRELARAFQLKGWALYRLCDAPAVQAMAERILGLCEQLHDRRGAAVSFKLKGVACLQLGQFAEAERFFKQGLAISQELGDLRNTAAMFNNLGETARLRGDDQAAAGLYQNALALARQIGSRESELIYLTNLSGAQLGLGQFQEVESALTHAINTSGGTYCSLPETYTFLSEACLALGKISQALESAARARSLAQDSGNDLFLGGAYRALARIATAFEKNASLPDAVGAQMPASVPDADTCFTEALELFRKINAESEQARTLRAWAEADLARGRLGQAPSKAQEALAIFQRLEATADVLKTEAVVGLASSGG